MQQSTLGHQGETRGIIQAHSGQLCANLSLEGTDKSHHSNYGFKAASGHTKCKMWGLGPRMLFSLSSSSKKIKQVFISWMLWSEKGQNFPAGARWLERGGRGKYLPNLSMSSYSIFLINIYLAIMWEKPAQTTAMWEIPLLFSSCQLLAGREERRENRDRDRVSGSSQAI